VVKVDMDVTLGANVKVNAGVPGKTLKHVIKKPDASADIERSRPVKVDTDGNFRFSRLAFDRRFAHVSLTSWNVSGSGPWQEEGLTMHKGRRNADI
jgi:hypothetical protein